MVQVPLINEEIKCLVLFCAIRRMESSGDQGILALVLCLEFYIV